MHADPDDLGKGTLLQFPLSFELLPLILLASFLSGGMSVIEHNILVCKTLSVLNSLLFKLGVSIRGAILCHQNGHPPSPLI